MAVWPCALWRRPFYRESNTSWTIDTCTTERWIFLDQWYDFTENLSGWRRDLYLNIWRSGGSNWLAKLSQRTFQNSNWPCITVIALAKIEPFSPLTHLSLFISLSPVLRNPSASARSDRLPWHELSFFVSMRKVVQCHRLCVFHIFTQLTNVNRRIWDEATVTLSRNVKRENDSATRRGVARRGESERSRVEEEVSGTPLAGWLAGSTMYSFLGSLASPFSASALSSEWFDHELFSSKGIKNLMG